MGDESMRKFYIFKIRNDYQNLYSQNPESLYHVLKYLYYLKPEENKYGIELFHQLVEMIDKTILNREIFIKYHSQRIYSKIGNTHIINDLYRDEISTLNIKHSYILLESKHNASTFFQILLEESNGFFLCDFKNQDYFWLSEVKTLV